MQAYMAKFLSLVTTSFALAAGLSPALGAQVGGVERLNCEVATTPTTSHNIGIAGATSLTFNGSITNLTISMVYIGTYCATYGPYNICSTATPPPQNWIVYLDTSNSTAIVISPTFNSSGNPNGYTSSTGTYTGGVTVNGTIGYNIATTLTLTSGVLSGNTCGITGSTYYVGS